MGTLSIIPQYNTNKQQYILQNVEHTKTSSVRYVYYP